MLDAGSDDRGRGQRRDRARRAGARVAAPPAATSARCPPGCLASGPAPTIALTPPLR